MESDGQSAFAREAEPSGASDGASQLKDRRKISRRPAADPGPSAALALLDVLS